METPAETAVREALESEDGIRRLGMMSGIKSNHRNLKSEDRIFEQDIDIHQRDLWGNESVSQSPKSSEEEMEVMAARDVIVNHQTPQDSRSAPQKSGMPGWQKALAGAAVATGMGGAAAGLATGAGAIGYWLANRNSPTVQQDANQYDLGLLPPNEPQ